MSVLVDLTGREIGAMTVLGRDGVSQGGKARWLVHCKLCGNNSTHRGEVLQRSSTKACGCLMGGKNLHDLVGKKFGHALVLSRSGTNCRNQATWLCRCLKCNRAFERVGTTLMALGDNQSCGCHVAAVTALRNRDQAQKIEVLGAEITISELSELIGYSKQSVYKFLRNGLTAEDILRKARTPIRSVRS